MHGTEINVRLPLVLRMSPVRQGGSHRSVSRIAVSIMFYQRPFLAPNPTVCRSCPSPCGVIYESQQGFEINGLYLNKNRPLEEQEPRYSSSPKKLDKNSLANVQIDHSYVLQ
jgi:hypothetical protein